MFFELSDEQKNLQQKFHKLAESHLRPLSLEIDQRPPGPIDSHFLRIMEKENFPALLIPEEYGGRPVDCITLAVILEELAWGSIDFVSIINATFHAIMTVLIGGTQEQKSIFLKQLLDSRGSVASFCPTEETGGSDSSSFSTLARKDDGQYILNGTKNPVINAGDCLFYVLWANLEEERDRSGINAFVVPGDAAGIKVGPYHDKSGMRGAPTASVIFDEVAVPRENLVGPLGSGYLLMMQAVDWGRVFVGATCVGIARAALETALDFAKTRYIKGRPIISNQGVSFILSELMTHLEAARLLVWKACGLMQSGLDFTAAASMAKLFASELAVRATSEGMLIMGHKSVERPSLMEKLQRDAQLTRIVEGTSQIQKAIIANQLQ